MVTDLTVFIIKINDAKLKKWNYKLSVVFNLHFSCKENVLLKP